MSEAPEPSRRIKAALMADDRHEPHEHYYQASTNVSVMLDDCGVHGWSNGWMVHVMRFRGGNDATSCWVREMIS